MTAPLLDTGEVLPLTRRLGACPDPLALFAQLTDGGRMRDTVLLESADRVTGGGARSILAVRSALRLTCRGRDVEVTALSPNGTAILPWLRERAARVAGVSDRAAGFVATFAPPPAGERSDAERLRQPSPLDVLRLAAAGPRLVSEPAELSYFAAGSFAYDLIDLFESLPAPRSRGADWPAYEAWVPDRVVVVDHAQRLTTVYASVFGERAAAATYHDAVQAVEALTRTVVGAREAVEDSRPVAAEDVPAARVDLSDAEYADTVRTLQGHIAAGDIFQAVPSRTFTLPCRDPLAAYAALRRGNPSPYMFFLHGTGGTLFGSSPETCVQVGGSPRTVTLRPIAGTVPRRAPDDHPDVEADARGEVALRTNAKELAEHLMLVDLARNDVSRISRPGTRRVTRLLDVERFSHVLHLVSEVTGELSDGYDALHAYAASMNMGTVVGAPKIRAAELLRALEPSARGAYGGAVGYLTHGGEMDTALVIRSALVHGGVAAVRAGAGVVADSDPDREAQETRHKAAAVLAAIAASEARDA
jgi:anthranilate synthase component I